MVKKICDICGKDMSLDVNLRSTKDYKFCISSYGKVWDVCDKCRNELNKWMKK